MTLFNGQLEIGQEAPPERKPITLRPIQVEPVQKGIDFFKKPKASPSIIIAPTAFGKSIVIAKIAAASEDNLLILQPSKELLEQNYGKYCAIGGRAAIFSASFNSKQIGKITYATIGSIEKLGRIFRERGFKKMIIDEVHLYPRNADSMLGKFLKDSGITHILGLTATPLKLQSGRDLSGEAYSKLVMLTSRNKHGTFFKEIIHVTQIQEMTALGYWAKMHYEQYDIDESKLVYNSTKADYTEESLKAVYQGNNLYEKIITKLGELQDRKSIIVFVPTVADANKLATMVPGSAAVSAEMKPAERNAAVNGFKSGKIRIIFNVNILATGFDHPGVDAIIMARPTASLAWFYQAGGRGTRIDPTGVKTDCLFIDFSGNVKRFGKLENLRFVLDGTWKLYGENDVLLTGVPLHKLGEFTAKTESDAKKVVMPYGKYAGKEVKDLPKEYRQWMLQNFTWNSKNLRIKQELERLSQ